MLNLFCIFVVYNLKVRLEAFNNHTCNLWNFAEGVWWEADDSVKFAQNMKDCKYITFKGVYAFCGNVYEGTETGLEKARDETIGKFIINMNAYTQMPLTNNNVALIFHL